MYAFILLNSILASAINETHRPQDFSVNCVNCSITGNLSVSAGGGVGPAMITPPATFETAGSATDFDFSDFWVGVVIDSSMHTFGFNHQCFPSIHSNDTNKKDDQWLLISTSL